MNGLSHCQGRCVDGGGNGRCKNLSVVVEIRVAVAGQIWHCLMTVGMPVDGAGITFDVTTAQQQ